MSTHGLALPMANREAQNFGLIRQPAVSPREVRCCHHRGRHRRRPCAVALAWQPDTGASRVVLRPARRDVPAGDDRPRRVPRIRGAAHPISEASTRHGAARLLSPTTASKSRRRLSVRERFANTPERCLRARKSFARHWPRRGETKAGSQSPMSVDLRFISAWTTYSENRVVKLVEPLPARWRPLHEGADQGAGSRGHGSRGQSA